MKTIQLLTAVFAASIIPLTSAAVIPVTQHVPPPGPVQAGAPVNRCSSWIQVGAGMTCDSIAHSANIDLTGFKLINPVLKKGCNTNLWAGYYYCTGKYYKLRKFPDA